jgi:hypothetical protein
LSLKNSYRASATCDAHIFGEKHPGRTGPRRDFNTEKFNIFIAISDPDFGKRAWRG